MLRRQSLAPAFAILLGAALCALPATNTRAGNVTQQPSASGPAWTWTWPDTAGTSGYVLTTDGTGVTSWAPPSGLGITLPLSSITAATTTSSIDSGSWAQTWAWSTLTTQTAFSLTTSSITTGTLLNLANTGKGGASTVLGISSITTGSGYGVYSAMTGQNNTGYAGYFTNTATSGVNYGIYSANSSASGYGGYFNNSGSGGKALYASSTGSGSYSIYATSNIGIAVFGQLSSGSLSGIPAIYGNATGSGNYGVEGSVNSTNGIGVYGLNNGSSASNAIGVKGVSNATGTGYGVYGGLTGAGNTGFGGYFTNAATSGVNFGVYGTDASSSGYGGFFTNTGTGWALAATGTSYLNGNVGIGTTSPGVLLDVQATNSLASIRIQTNSTNASGQNTNLLVTSYTNNNASPGIVFLTERGTVGSPAAINSGDSIGNISWLGGYDTAWGSYAGAVIFAQAAENFSTGHGGTDLFLEVTDIGSTIPAAAMTVYHNRNVGIGTTSPGSLLDIGLAGTTTGTMRLEGGGSGYVQIQPSGAAGSWTMTLPAGPGTNNYVLSTNGSGVTSWVSAGSVIGGTALSALTSAQASDSFDNAAYGQIWTWNSLTTGTGLTLSSSSLTTGTVLSLANTALAATSTGKVLSISDATTGAGYGVYSVMSGAGNTGFGGYFANTSTAGWALYANGRTYLNGTTTVAGNLVVTGTCTGCGAGGGATALSSITSATTTSSIDSGANAIAWNWNSLTSGTALSFSSSSITSGTLLDIEAANTGGTGYAGYFSQSGTGASYGVYSTNASTGAGYAVYGRMTGAGNAGAAGYFTNASGSGYGIYALGTTSTGGIFGGSMGQGAAILAYESNASNTGAAIYAINASANGYAIFGYNTSGAGGVGIEGAGNPGVYGISTAATAGSTGVYAFQNSVTGQTFGVQSSDYSPSGYAVYGLNFATTGNARGVYGETNSTTSGRAVEGKQSGAGNTGYGGRFSNAATSGVNYGVYGTDASGSGYGGFFTNTGTGWALAATGTSYFNGNVGIGTTGPATALDVNGDITNRNVTSCAMLGTDSTGKLVCQTPAVALVSTQTASNSASLSWTGLTGSKYWLTCQNMIAATGGENLNVQFGEGGGPTWKTTGYNWGYPYGAVSGSTPSPGASGNTNDVGINVAYANNTAPGASFQLTILPLSSGTAKKMVTGTSIMWENADSVVLSAAIGGYYNSDTTAVTAVRLIETSGNITSGSCSLYALN